MQFVRNIPIGKLMSFALVGSGVFLLGQAMLYVLVDKFYWYPSAANAAQLAVSFWLNYRLNRRLTWPDRTNRAMFQRFVLSRTATTLLSFALFNVLVASDMHYLLANVVGVGTGTAVNYLVSEYWVFGKHGRQGQELRLDELRLSWRTALTMLALLAAAGLGLWLLSSQLFVPVLLVLLALLASVAALLFLVSLLYTQRHHTAAADQRLRPPGGTYTEKIAVLMPARHERADLAFTMLTAAWSQGSHPSHRLLPVVCDDDPDTIRVVMAACRTINEWWAMQPRSLGFFDLWGDLQANLAQLRFDGSALSDREQREINVWRRSDALVQIIVFPLEGRKPSKPKQLNHAFRLLRDRDDFTLFTILDAESLSAKGLLIHVDQAFQDRPHADIGQGGVQLMEPTFNGTRGQKLGQYLKRWYSWHNLLEYFRWFQGQMPFQSDNGFVPLGGNTVFVRTRLLEKTDGWPETLTEDCALGVLATAVYGAKTFTFYDPSLVTREETPPTVGELVKQRTRWNQGFLQTFLSGQWRALPTVRQRLLALWILSSAFFQALSVALLPVTLLTMVAVKSPPSYVLVMCVPVAAMVISTLLQVKQLREFAVAYDRGVSWYTYLLVVLTQPLYQWVLGYAALRAVVRHVRGHDDWHKTARAGDNLAALPLPTVSVVSAQAVN